MSTAVATPPVTRAREAWPDILRVVVIAGVVAMHASTAYVVDIGWYYEDRTTSEAWQIGLTVPAFLGGLFVLGPLFFAAGWLSPRSLARKGPRGFAIGRLLRLGGPLLLFTFLVDPLTDFWGDHLEGGTRPVTDYLLDRTGSRDTGPFWFVAVILLFSLGYAGWRWWRPESRLPERPGPRSLAVVLSAVAVGSFVLWQWSSLTAETFYNLHWGQWPQGIVMFGLGVWAGERGWLDDWLPAVRRRLGWAAVTALAVLLGLSGYALAQDDVAIIAGSLNLATFAFTWCDAVIAVAGCLWLVAALRRRRFAPSRLRDAASRASYAAYLIHPPVLVALSALLVDWSVQPQWKFLVVAPLGVPAAYAVGYLLTRVPGLRRVL